MSYKEKESLIKLLRHFANELEASNDVVRFDWTGRPHNEIVAAPLESKYGMHVMSGGMVRSTVAGITTIIQVTTMRPSDEVVEDKIRIIKEYEEGS